MTPSEIVEKIIELCLKDEKWREAFEVSNSHWYYKLHCPDLEGMRQLSEPCVEFGDKDDRGSGLVIPLTQLLLSEETARVLCMARGDRSPQICDTLEDVLWNTDRLKYYEDYFIKPIKDMERGNL